MSFSCPRCLGDMISYPRFADLCMHMEYDHGMWYLGKNSSWPNRWQQLQAEERMLEEELKRSALEDDPEWSGLSSWAGSSSEFDSPLHPMNELDRRNNIRLKHIEQILGQTKSELDVIKTKVIDRRGEVKNLRRQLQVNNRNTAAVQSRLHICTEELQNLRGELSLRDKELEEKTREANDLNKFVKDLKTREKRAKQELRIYLDKLFRRIINTENQLRIVERGLSAPMTSHAADFSQPSTSTSYPDSGYDNVVIKECSIHNKASCSSVCRDGSKAKRNLRQFNEHVYTQGAYERTMRLVFWYLEIDDLLKCRLVCKEWKKRAQRTEYWTKVIIKNRQISSKFLQVISMFCLKTKYILLQGLTGPPVIESEDDNKTKYNKGSLENGLDYLLQSCNKHLLSLSIIDCSNIITDRCLWLAGTNNRNLMKLAYISDCYPAGAEAIWSLGAGCRNITTIIVPPISSSESHGTFNNRSLLMVGKCWPELRVLCIGGTNIDLDGLISVSVLCSVLEHLELDHVGEVRNTTAEMMTDTGLQHLEAIYFTHTPVSTKALLTFYKKCPKLKTLMVQVSIEDYFQNTSDSSNICEYNSRIAKLKALERNSELTGILSCEASPLF